jgi:hypothetical protein
MLNFEIYFKPSLCMKALRLLSFLLILATLLIWQSAFAAISITAGNDQQVNAGLASADIVFALTDEHGNPSTGATVNFTLADSEGNAIENGLTPDIAISDDKGEVSTRLVGRGSLGDYTITAIFGTDAAQTAQARITIIPGSVVHLTTIEGQHQKISKGKPSANIHFALTDAFNNRVPGEVVNFYVKTPTGETTNTGLDPSTATSNGYGQVTTRLAITELKGTYTITAALASEGTLIARAFIQVIPAAAAITVINGGSQMVPAGAESSDITFSVIDEQGNPKTGLTVNFNLVDPKGNPISEDGLTAYTAETDDNGQAITRLKGTHTVGNHTLTGVLENNTALFIGTSVIVVAGSAAQLTVIEGENQTLSGGKMSAMIRFKLTDAFKNALSGEVINFQLKTPTGEFIGTGLSTTLATTNINGEVSLRLQVPETQGTYTLIATLATSETLTAHVTVQVTEALPTLPSLGFGAAVDKTGQPVNTTARFYGGTAQNPSHFNQEIVLENADQTVSIQGMIKVDSRHIGQAADIIVVVSYQSIEPAEVAVMIMLGEASAPLWDGQLGHLIPFKRVDNLPESYLLKIYEGTFGGLAGKVQIYFGYRLDNGVIVYNANEVISILLK